MSIHNMPVTEFVAWLQHCMDWVKDVDRPAVQAMIDYPQAYLDAFMQENGRNVPEWLVERLGAYEWNEED